MTIHTMTTEKTFEGLCDHGSLTTAVQTAVQRMQRAAEGAKYEHDVPSTFRLTVARADRESEVRWRAEASSVYAKIVPAPQEKEPVNVAGVIDSVPGSPFQS